MLVSFFKGKCKWCADEFDQRTGSADECNRCRTIMTLMAPLSIHEIQKLLNACNTSKAPGHWRIRWEDSENRSE